MSYHEITVFLTDRLGTIALCYLVPAVAIFLIIICSEVECPEDSRTKGRHILSYSFFWPYNFTCAFILIIAHTVTEVSKHLKKRLWDNF